MRIVSTEEMRSWDAFTIEQEGIRPLDLMERAAQACTDWIIRSPFQNGPFRIFCGKGNNGGDGLAMARQLTERGLDVAVYILEFGKPGSDDFQANLSRLHDYPIAIQYIQSTDHLPPIDPKHIVIDALYGTGLDRPLEGLANTLVRYLNAHAGTVIAIDMPSGLFADRSTAGSVAIEATITLTFQAWKRGLLAAENARFVRGVEVLDIRLQESFWQDREPAWQLADYSLACSIYRPRNRFAHKGTHGHTLIMGGSLGKTGALQLAVGACLRAGAGLTTAYGPGCAYIPLQTAQPEAMMLLDPNLERVTALPTDLVKYAAIGCGPGLGTDDETVTVVAKLLQAETQRLVLDADALNILSSNPDLLLTLPPDALLTPHPKEFDRLFGSCENEFERGDRARLKAKELGVILVLKGHHTLICLPGGQAYFNMSGNAGLAKGGSGDVLTGILTALLAQGYDPVQAALLGVWLHGSAADEALSKVVAESMLPTDVIGHLSAAYSKLGG